MRFTDFLKATVMTSAAAATVLATITVIVASAENDPVLTTFTIAWWTVAALIGAFLGRRAQTSPPIARLLANARTTRALPEVRPGRVLLNRLWPLLLCTALAGGLSFLFPQVPAIATGFALISALAWRRQDGAVAAVEGRDGVRYFVERTSPLQPIRLVRAPGFKTHAWELEEAGTPI